MKKFFYRLNEEGNAVIFHETGEAATKLGGPAIYPIGSLLSTHYEHPEGIILSVEDAEKLGVEEEL